MSHNFKHLILGGMLVAVVSVSLSADTISTFNIGGTVTVTNTAITWTLNESPFTPDKTIIGPGADGLYAGLDGTNATIYDVLAGEGSGSPLMSFDAAPGLSMLEITGFLPAFGTPAACTNPTPTAGQMCTPLPGSPFTFINTSRNSSSLDFDMFGVTADGLSTWEGDFSSQFGQNFQTIVATLGTGGSAFSTYSATFTVTTDASPVPEPTTIGLSVLGIGLIALVRARKVPAAS